MESLSRQFQRKKLSNAKSNNSYGAAYDGVFAGGGGGEAPKLGAQPQTSSRIEDYGEIFGRSRAASSIPILDVSALDGPKVSASKLDYSVIFGGCGDGDLGVSYEEMFAKPKECRNFYTGAKPPTKTLPHSDGSDQVNRNRVEAFQNDADNQSFEGVKQFNMSYHKSSQRNNGGINGTTRITQLGAVPGFTCFIEENSPLQKPSPQKKEGDKYVAPPKVNATSPPRVYANAAKTHSSDGTGKFESQSSSYNFHSVEKSFGANESRTHSSKMSSPSSGSANLMSNKSMPKRSTDSNSKVPKSDASRAGSGYGSPSFSDEELDANSAAAASAAALKKAIETAQASIRIARDFMERKKDGTHRFSKPSSKDGVDINNRRKDKVTIAQARFTENAKETSHDDDIVFQVFSKSEREKARRSGKVAPDLKQTEEISIIKEVVREQNGNKLETDEACGALRQISGVENRSECRTPTLSREHAGGRNKSFESVYTHGRGRKEMETEKEILKQPDGSGKKVYEEARKLEDVEVKLFSLTTTRDLEQQHIDRLDAVQEVQEKEHTEKRGVAQLDEETKEKQNASNAQEKSEELEEFFEPTENDEFDSPVEKANNNEAGLHEGPECMENGKKLEDIFVEEQNENWSEQKQNEELSEEFFDLKEIEEFESQGVKVNNNEEGLDEALGCLENQRKREDICVEEENENWDHKENEEFESHGVKANNNEEGLDEPEGCMENERKQEDNFGEEQNELPEEFLDLKENEVFDSEGVKANNSKEQHYEAQECMESEKKLEDILDAEQTNKLLDDIREEESGNELREICKQNKFDKGLEASGLWAGYEGTVEVESIEKKQHDSHEGDDKESFDKSHELDISDQRFSDTFDEEESEEKQDNEGAVEVEIIEKKQHDAHEDGDDRESFDKSHEPDISEERFSDTSDGEESEEKQDDDSDLAVKESILVDEDEDTENIQRETEGNEATEVYQELVVEAMNLDASINAKSEAGESVSESEEVHSENQDDNDLYFEENEENERISDVTVSSGEFTWDGLEAAEMAHEVGEKENCNSGGLVGDATEHIEMEKNTQDGSEALLFNHSSENIGLTDTSYEAKRPDQNGKESGLTSSVGSGIKISVCDSSVEGEKEVDEKIVADLEEGKSNLDEVHVRRVRKQWFETGKKIESSQPPSVFEGEEKTIGIDEEIKTHPIINEVAKGKIIDEVAKGNLDAAQERRVRKQWFETGKKTEPSQPSSLFKGEDKTMRKDEEIETNPVTEKNVDNLAKAHTVQEKETKEIERKEAKKEPLRKVDEAKKREREREKDRMAVERAIREARERAFAEARERAERAAVERATAEARKRVMAEAREKVDKAAAIKSSAEKASMEAKLRAERAAVERATMEARERALEKALSQKPPYGTREQAERYVAEKVSGVYRESGTRQNFSSPDKKLDESNGESAERRKARLERNQRTTERAAKALAEKNKRDLLAQKEQAERNRYAETLDAEVKRWSSGKEGNLRALLSTLQYVLGPNSGWQPVSLTEIITTSAVRKAYRKATLHVHPDKLQQRGATIQQKYICEKVFDLLKAAWNKFNSEER